jgi:TPR repeat protein
MAKSRKRVAVIVVLLFVLGAASFTAFVLLKNDRRALDDAVVTFKNGDFAEAVALLSPLAEAGEPRAQKLLGIAYAYGHGVEPDSALAQQLLRSVLGADVAGSYFHIARSFDARPYEKRDPVVPDDQQALAWYIAAAEQGHKEAQALVAQAYKDGGYGLTPIKKKRTTGSED